MQLGNRYGRLTVGHNINCAVYRLNMGLTVSATENRNRGLNLDHYRNCALCRLYHAVNCQCNRANGKLDYLFVTILIVQCTVGFVGVNVSAS